MTELSKEISAEALGLEETVNVSPVHLAQSKKATTTKKSTKTDVQAEIVNKVDEAAQVAATNLAMKVAAEANAELAVREAEKQYIIQKQKFMLEKCKSDDVVEFVGNKLYANYFGPVYTFLLNAIPVTVKFDGSKQKFPRFVRDAIERKISEVADSNTPKVDIENRSE